MQISINDIDDLDYCQACAIVVMRDQIDIEHDCTLREYWACPVCNHDNYVGVPPNDFM